MLQFSTVWRVLVYNALYLLVQHLSSIFYLVYYNVLIIILLAALSYYSQLSSETLTQPAICSVFLLLLIINILLLGEVTGKHLVSKDEQTKELELYWTQTFN